MKKITSTFTFYYKPLLLVCIINMVLFIFPGSYLEEYEVILSSYCHGTYSLTSLKEWNLDSHFLLFSIYQYLNTIYPNVQIYGIVLLINNILSLILFGLLLYRVLRVNLNKYNIWLFTLLYLLYAIDNTVNLGTDRFLFTYAIVIFGYIESVRLEGKQFSKFQWFVISLFYVYLSLLRMEAVILSAIFYAVLLLLNKRLYKMILLPLIISVTVYIGYNIIMTYYMPEERQAYYYKEIDFLTRSNIDIKHITTNDSISVNGFYSGITDKEHFTIDFYNRISSIGAKHGFENLLNGLNLKAVYGSYIGSVKEWKLSLSYILFFAASCFLVIMQQFRNPEKWMFIILWMFIFPFLIYFYTYTPARFLVPYYAFTGIYNSLLYLMVSKKTKILYTLLLFILCISSINATLCRNKYLKTNDRFIRSENILKSMTNNKRFLKPIIICGFDMNRFYPVKPLQRVTPKNVLILNNYYFNSFNSYIQAWNKACNCDGLSFDEKINYIISNGNLCIVDDTLFNHMHEFYKLKYKKNLTRHILSEFDDKLKVYTLNYENQ